ncbi:uncharacterized protein LOC126905927 [Daktulosphaira vitifoliae]|uniref:uncharacterized protein LOC126905927 n=1 Tax=Daktulosphaira vitifoliae TaxID=58002 RepID=UPI0021AAAC3D|nr:uncharacterized protein LOC126905927 [Daktulosphaira vitifoliae]
MTLNHFQKVFIGWSLVISGGLFSFYLSKRYIDSKRFDSMKARERMRFSNIGEYTPSERKF